MFHKVNGRACYMVRYRFRAMHPPLWCGIPHPYCGRGRSTIPPMPFDAAKIACGRSSLQGLRSAKAALAGFDKTISTSFCLAIASSVFRGRILLSKTLPAAPTAYCLRLIKRQEMGSAYLLTAKIHLTMESNEREKLSRLMKLSWDIQQNKSKTRGNALKAAWAIISNEDITVYYLVKKVMPEKADPVKVGKQLGLFRFV